MNKYAIMAAFAVVTLALTACDDQSSKTENTQKTETSSGTVIERKTTTETTNDGDGQINRETKTETTVDPQGLMNKKTTSEESTETQTTD